MAKITIKNLNTSLEALPGHTLLVSLLNEDIPIPHGCGGKARCGCCRIQILGSGKGLSPINNFEIDRLGETLVKNGWRLACQTHTLRDIEVYLPTKEELDSGCSRK